jgi:tetratricopeptide (TPR) repeat protein
VESDSDNSQSCPHCGNALAAGSATCPDCGRRISQPHFSPETVLVFCAILISIFFLVTRSVARAYHAKLGSLAQQWFESGQQQLQSGNAAQARVDFRTALVYAPDDPRIQFPLAEALAASGRDTEARAYLLGLLAHSPSDAPVNLALARISARTGSETDALRYYHGAIFGVWPEEPAKRRLQTRFELCQFLLDRNDASSAEAELIVLAPEIRADDAQAHVRAGDMFIRAGDPGRAMEEYRRALSARPSLFPALRGAGITAFQLGDYSQAAKFLDPAHRQAKNDAEIAADLETSRFVLSADPFAPGLTEEGRRDRVRADFRLAFSRLQDCTKTVHDSGGPATPQDSDLADMYRKANVYRLRLSDRYLRRAEDLSAALDFTFEVENVCAQKCGPPRGADQALLLLEKFQQGGQR